MNRRPNSVCSICEKPVYRRPSHLIKYKVVFCSKECMKATGVRKVCPICNNTFKPTHTRNKTCSRSCSNTGRFGIKYKTGIAVPLYNHTSNRMRRLVENFDFNCCMVEGCEYNTIYEIHRYIPRADGGDYVIGNMFAICPNHHAEVTRKIIEFEKVSDCVLRVVKKE